VAEAIAALEAAQAATAKQWDRAVELFAKAGDWDKLLKVEWLARAQKTDAALELAQAEIKDNPGTILPSAVSTYVRWQARGAHDAQTAFEKLREECAAADLDTPLLARLEPLATELGYEAAWAKPLQPKPDIGPRPALDSLGPFRYAPYQAPNWQGVTRDNVPVDASKYAGKPTLVIFYLGFGCLHCVEQLQEFSPVAAKFREAGIELVGVSTETPEQLASGLDAYDKPLDIPLVADPELKAFKAFRCYDDFEKQPLHGTFLIDAQGRVLWQDISYEPFKDEEFLQKEATRLLSLPR
jgi:peroxiredoxin